MQLTIREMKGPQIQVELGNSSSILCLKQLIQQELGHAPSQQKLVFKGKILEDSKLLSEYSIPHSTTLVLVMSKPASPPPAVYSENSVSSDNELPLSSSSESPEAGLSRSETLLTEIGYSLATVQAALAQCSGSYGAALVLLLTTSLPLNSFSSLLAEPQFLEVLSRLREDPEDLQGILSRVQETNLGLYQRIQMHHEEFLGLVRPPPREELTGDEEEEVRELMTLGFSAQDALEAYLGCNRDKALAASFLFDNRP